MWRVIHCILHPSPKPLQADPDRLNKFFLSTNERTLGTKPNKRSDLIDVVNSFSECPRTSHPFNLRCVCLMEVEKEIDKLRSDTSTGIDHIPVKFVKLTKVHISGPLTHIINRCIATSRFPRLWKIARVSPMLITVRSRFYRHYLKSSSAWCSTSLLFTSTRKRFSVLQFYWGSGTL